MPFTLAARGGWPAVSGEMRPATPAEVRQFRHDAANAASPAESAAAASAFYADKVKRWDVLDAGDAPAAVTAEAVGRLPYPLWHQLDDVCCGYVVQDGATVLGN